MATNVSNKPPFYKEFIADDKLPWTYN